MHERLARLGATLAAMPPVAAMGITVVEHVQHRLSLAAPLAANLNDKGNAFGGSLASILTLSGWGLATLELEAAGLQADVYVADSQVRYLAPLYGDLQATAQCAEDASWEVFLQRFATRGHASIQLQAQILADGRPAATMTGRFVAKARVTA
ncbi:thioesterase [Stenotrophomonas ginsengisoli]|uniref:Thioesterase n=1 Tax=Stenotrophomonas ginsengisoli TaxID=336566 RepID=A0A0R0DAH3_9GAMM|nr:YiiD C-terminal domain-containing protein [Stenotrophomonas ginsengisoli]KRG74355.1 thioesterase [Stenotrophomonas ginsengisoli]